MTVIFVALNVAVYVFEILLYNFTPINGETVRSYLALSWDITDLNGHKYGVSHGHVWQLLTYQFLHETPWPWHLLFNCLGLYFLGREIEEALGRRTFTKLYLLSGFLGGLLHLLLALLVPAGSFGGAVVGASAGVCGLLAAFAGLFPDRQITMLVFFVIPVTLRAKYLLYLGAAWAFIGTIMMTQSKSGGIAHDAHLGGVIAGYCYLRWGIQVESFFMSRRARGPRLRPRELVKVPTGQAWQRPKSSTHEDLGSEEFISREVDPILDKISAHGIQSLTPEEKRILEAARARIEKR